MIKRFKWISGVLAAIVAAGCLSFPSATSAQTEGKINLKEELLNARKQQVIRQIKQYEDVLENNRKVSRPKSGTTVQSVTSVTYKGSVSLYETHSYVFETTGGTLHMNVGHPEESVGYLLQGMGDGNWGEYRNGDTLPAGRYRFTVLSSETTPVDYTFTLDGVTFTSVDETLPIPTMTSPTGLETRVEKGTTQVTVEGSHDGDWTEIFYNGGRMSLIETFSVQVPVSPGINRIKLYAGENSGNEVVQEYRVIVPGTKRIGGANRYEVSAKISQEMSYDFHYGNPVIIARGDLYTDALSGVSLAGLEGAPILLSDYKTQSLPSPIKSVIAQLMAKKAIILGGTGSVSTNVENELRRLGVSEIIRIDGPNRFAVSAKIGARVLSSVGGAASGINTAIVASGLVFPDALSASSPSGRYLLPILQVTKDNVPTEIDEFIKNHPYIKNFIIVGGPGTVSDTVKAKLQNYAKARGGVVDRIGGANRYEVAINIAKYAPFAMEPGVHVFAKGTDFPDALSGGPLAANFYAPILLTPTNQMYSSVQTYLNNTSGKDFYYILGGTGSISMEVENQLNATLQ